jgi:hypothetical protein
MDANERELMERMERRAVRESALSHLPF